MHDSTVKEVPEVYSGPFRRRRRDMQATLMVVANAESFAPLATPPVKPKPLNLASLQDGLLHRPLPQESMHTEPPDPDYMGQQKGPFWRATHD